MLPVHIGGKLINMLLDTGAAFTCLHPNDAHHLPRAPGKFRRTIGFSGHVQLNQLTVPVMIRLEDKVAKLPILIASHTPINLLGRDALCQLGVTIDCTPGGIEIVDIPRQMSVVGGGDC